MKIKEFRLKNYKSFLDSQLLSFNKGLNIIVGKNNSGKTALIEALSTSITSKPHLSERVKPTALTPIDSVTSFEIAVEISGLLAKNLCMSLQRNDYVYVPVPNALPTNFNDGDLRNILNQIFDVNPITLRFHCEITNGTVRWPGNRAPILEQYSVKSPGAGQCQYFGIKPTQDRTNFDLNRSFINSESHIEFGAVLRPQVLKRIYKFNAERLNIGVAAIGTSERLEPDARNLPEVLLLLQSSRQKAFRAYNDLVRKVFPEIHHLGVRPISANQAEIYIMMTDKDRSDLSFKLSECGTGVGQVLAILYVAFSEVEANVIIIDEPNSFLHPGATKALINIMAMFSHHQYIISSHSTEVFKAPNVSTLKLVNWKSGESSVKSFSLNAVTETKECLQELGIEMSDLLSSDKLTWVEGPTEQNCYPLILQRLYGWADYTHSFIPVKNTGDFEGPRATTVLEVYQKMVNANLLLPKEVSFIFDSEKKTTTEKNDLSRLAPGKVHFLPYRLYENYLLDPSAIVELFGTFEFLRGKSVAVNDVEKWIAENGTKYSSIRDIPNIQSNEWLASVDGAKLLKDIVIAFTDSTEKYEKIKHGMFLTKRLLDRDSSQLNELGAFLRATL